MTSRALIRSLSTTLRPSYALSRSYVIPARTLPTTTLKSTFRVPKLAASTTPPSNGSANDNPDIAIETLPDTTAGEVNTTPELGTASGLSPWPPSPDSADQLQQPGTDWSKSYHGLSSQAFSKEIAEVLLAPIDPLDVEMKPGT